MNASIAISLFGAVLSMIACILTFLFAELYSKKIREYKKTLGNLISPQREYVENKVYLNSSPLIQDPDFFKDANNILFEPSSNKELLVRTTLPDFSFFEDMGISLSEVKVDEKTVMCVMPFNRKFDKIRDAIADACIKMGYKFYRSDDELIADNTDLRKSIVRMILEARVVVAVLDGRNPNVFYEIGIAHSLGKLVLMVVNLSREENKRLAVDLLSNRLIVYNNLKELKEKLMKALNAIHEDGRGQKEENS